MAYHSLSPQEISDKTNKLFEKYPVKKVSIFGSCSRNEMKRGSDVDILIELSDQSSPLLFVELTRKLEHILQRKVDLISYSSLEYSDMKNEILSDAKVIYEKRH